MKRKTLYAPLAAVTAAVMLSCTACGGQTDDRKTDHAAIDEQEITSGQREGGSQETEPGTTDGATSQTGNPQAAGAPGKEGGTQPTGRSGQDDADDQQHDHVTLDWQTIENSDTAEDGTLLYTGTCTYPIISIKGNQAAADNINASIQGYVTAFNSDTSIQSFARENYVPEDTGFIAYSNDLSFAARRSDSNVISFEAVFYAYSGGAHGNYSTVGLNYDTRTGEPIGFAELGENADSFRADTFAFNRALADTPAYQEKMYDGSPSDEQLEEVLYAEDAWFLSTSGLTFISNPYALGPYAAGAIEFTIPYDELAKMGLRKEYRYDGNLMIKLLDNIPVSADLNGDENEEAILYYTEYDGSPDAKTEYVTHFLINDTDVANGINDELNQLMIDFPWSQCLLYDLNPSDNTIEFAFITTEYPDDSDDALLTSHFFRYEKDGSVSFLGTMDGSVLDPAAIISVTAP